MAKVLFDGNEHTVRDGVNLIEAGKDAGVEIPHFCYHPRLRIVGQCRMCLVEVEGMPKVQAACNVMVKEGMKVTTKSAKVIEARQSVLEFLLVNHPLDCPICDKAGECLLQDNTFGYGAQDSRSIEIRRTYPGRERLPIGPHVIFNMNRCIHCTRCIRFTEQISETYELGFFERSGKTEVGVYPGRELDNPLSANVTDICPVGALTASEFRFRSRVWNLEEESSICNGCNVGCNITVEHAKNEIYRTMPRVNPAVNDYWLCDYGRFNFMAMAGATRLQEPAAHGEKGARGLSWRAAIDLVAERLRGAIASGSPKRLMALGSPFLTNEENYLIAWLFGDVLGSPNLDTGADSADPKQQLIRNPSGWIHGSESAPNLAGARDMGIAPRPGGFTLTDLLAGRVQGANSLDVLYVADGGFSQVALASEAVRHLRDAARFLIVGGWRATALTEVADLVLPGTLHAEKEGTFTNLQGRVQRLRRACFPPGEARAEWEILTALAQHFSSALGETKPRAIFDEIARNVDRYQGMSYQTLGDGGQLLPPASSVPPVPPQEIAS